MFKRKKDLSNHYKREILLEFDNIFDELYKNNQGNQAEKITNLRESVININIDIIKFENIKKITDMYKKKKITTLRLITELEYIIIFNKNFDLESKDLKKELLTVEIKKMINELKEINNKRGEISRDNHMNILINVEEKSKVNSIMIKIETLKLIVLEKNQEEIFRLIDERKRFIQEGIENNSYFNYDDKIDFYRTYSNFIEEIEKDLDYLIEYKE